MVTDSIQADKKSFGLFDVFESPDGWIKLPVEAMRECGPAAQTLGSIMRWVTIRETYMAQSKIAEKARVPRRTLQRHLDRLEAAGYVGNLGRQKTRANRKRRTATIRIRGRARAAAEQEWGVLPFWALCTIRNHEPIPWSAKAVLSVILARLAGMRVEAEKHEGEWLNGEDLMAIVDEFGGEDKFQFSQAELMRQTGLAKEAIVTAKDWLGEHGIIEFDRGTTRKSGGSGRDILFPSRDFVVVETPAGEDRIFLDFFY